MNTKGSDIIAMFSKGLLGAIPFVGPLAAEVVGTIIPNQRLDRIESFLEKLEQKLEDSNKENIKDEFVKEEAVDLFEDALYQAARTLSEERKEHIASLIKNSLNDNELQHIEYKKLLYLLGQLNDVQVIILKSYVISRRDPAYNDFYDKHEKTLHPPSAHSGSTREEIDRYTVFTTYGNHLVDLGLLRRRFTKPKKGEFPVFDEKTGMIKAQGHDITPLGRLLLRSIDQGGEF